MARVCVPSRNPSKLLFNDDTVDSRIGSLLKSYLQQTKFALAYRPFIALTNLEDLAVFPDVASEVLSVFEDVMKKYTVILQVMFPY